MSRQGSGRLLLDHSIVGQSVTTLTVRKDRNLAACRICGDIFQPRWFIQASDADYANDLTKLWDGELEIQQWRDTHRRKHSERELLAFTASGLTFTPEAAHKLAPFGLAPVTDAVLNPETEDALLKAPRAPIDDVDTTLRNWR